MSDLESAEQYVRTHELIESLHAERRPLRDAGSEEDARLNATAALLHAAAPESGTVDPGFAARLFARLEAEQARQQTEPAVAAASAATPVAGSAHDAAPAAERAPAAPGARQQRTGMSRRGVLLGGLGAAAAALTGAAVTAALEQASHQPPASAPTTIELVPAGTGTWVAIATLDAVPLGAIKRFEAGAVVGFLQHTASGFVALSGVCTHMACLLQWNGADKTFDCPCHGGRFLANGKAAPGGRYSYAPLPSIQTKVESQQVWVYVTGGEADDGFPSTPTSATSHGNYGGAITPLNK